MDDPGGAEPMPDLYGYASEVTARRLEKMLTYVDGVRQAEDIEAVHQMRVWSRRTRAALEIFRVCFGGRAFDEIEREVKAATDALSEARDLDVMIENLDRRAAKLRVDERSGLASFVDRLKQQREKIQEDVVRAVTDLECHDLARRFSELAKKQADRRVVRIPERSEPATAADSSEPRARRNGKRSRRNG